jgi:hypothetical protein
LASDEGLKRESLLRYVKTIVIIVLALYALAVVGYIFIGSFGEHGANDFHQYWYSGKFILAGRDPYEAFLSGASLPARQPGLEVSASNTPPLLLVLSPLSFLPWAAAKSTWLLLNLLFAGLVFWLVVEKIPFPDVSLDHRTKILIFLLFFNLSPTRIAIENGQITLLVIVLMLVSILLAERSWLLSGFLLGMALSKFSVSLPVALFFLYHRKSHILLTASLVQLLGFTGVAMFSGNPLMLVLEEYFRIFMRIKNLSGIHLASLIPGKILDDALSALMSLTLFSMLYAWLIRKRPSPTVNSAVLDVHLLTIFALWSLLVGYHRLHDAPVLLLLIVLAFKSFRRAEVWHLAPRMRAVVAVGLGVGLALLTIPARLVNMFIPGTYGLLANRIPSVILLVFVCAMMALLHRFLYPPVSLMRRPDSSMPEARIEQ